MDNTCVKDVSRIQTFKSKLLAFKPVEKKGMKENLSVPREGKKYREENFL